MKALLGSVITSTSGRLGGSIFEMAKSGLVIKNFGFHPSITSRSQRTVQSNLFLVRKAWRNLSVANKNLWLEHSRLISSDKNYNGKKFLSGYSLYVSANMNRLQCSQAVLSLPVALNPFHILNVISITTEVVNSRIVFSFSGVPPTDYYMYLFATRPMPSSCSKAPNNYKLISRLTYSNFPAYNLSTNYTNKYPSFGPVGSRIFFKFIFVHIASGLTLSPRFYNSLSLI